MYIDTAKIVKNVNSKYAIRNSYIDLKENYSPIGKYRFFDMVRKESCENIIKNSRCLLEFDETRELLKDTISISHLCESDLYDLKDDIINCENSKDVLDLIESLINEQNDPSTIINENYMDVLINRFEDSCSLTEANNPSYLLGDMGMIAKNINSIPETIYEYLNVVKEIEMTDPARLLPDIPKILVKSTDIIIACKVTVTGDVLKLLAHLPRTLAYKVIDSGSTKSQKKRYINIIDTQMKRVSKVLNDGDDRQFVLARAYLEQLRLSKEIIRRDINVVEEMNDILDNDKDLQESIPDMQPTVPNDTEDDIEELSDQITENICVLLFSDDNKLMIESAYNLGSLMSVSEAKVHDKVVRGAVAAAKATQKISDTVTHTNTDNKRVVTAVKKIPEPFVNSIKSEAEKIRKMDAQKRKESALENSFRSKITNLVRQGIKFVAGAGGAYAIGSVVGIIPALIVLISVLGSVAKNLGQDSVERKQIVNELESELRIVKEKIDDAKSKGDNKEKYELMRIEQKLTNEINRLKYNPKLKADKSVYNDVKSSNK